MTKKIILFLAVAVSMVFTSCMDTSNSGSKNTLRYAGDRYFLHVVDRSTGNAVNSNGATTEFVIHLKNSSMAVSMRAENWVIGGESVTFTIPETEFKISSIGGVTLKSGQLITENGVTLENFDLEIAYPMSQEPYTWTRLSFTYKNYNVSFVQSNIFFYGRTVSQASNPAFTTEEPVYGVSLNPSSMKAAIYIANAQFMEKMPPQNISLSDLPLVINNNSFSIHATDAIPKIGATPYPNYVMKEFDFNAQFSGPASCRFVCSEQFWTVNATLNPWVIPQNNNGNGGSGTAPAN
ncbi:MAG: hypothetical protein K2M04_07895 [Muribaculaceae bacterium]|nr:hypothetical protein [Muribaculaceae bacterium]